MPPFSSMLRTKKGRKSRPRTPPSPGSFYSPSVARSPAPWISERASIDASSNEPSGHGSIGRRAPPPSAWADRALPRPPRSTSKDGLQLDLGEDLAGPSQPQRPLSTSSPRTKTPGLHVPSPLGEPNSPVPASLELGPVSGSKTLLADAQRKVPTPIKIPRAHVNAPSVTIQRSPSPCSSSARPASNCPSSTSGSISASPAPSEGAPELMSVLRAERASASMLGLGFTLRESVNRLSAFGSVRMDSATLPVEVGKGLGLGCGGVRLLTKGSRLHYIPLRPFADRTRRPVRQGPLPYMRFIESARSLRHWERGRSWIHWPTS
ncbi:hypothetical protein B0J17DRAFT_431966 [Rhizoctonia solani]|nr:hypothetical protein B0J17DRAFT_431966 [Rhizoctonia solani]